LALLPLLLEVAERAFHRHLPRQAPDAAQTLPGVPNANFHHRGHGSAATTRTISASDKTLSQIISLRQAKWIEPGSTA
jgi:hypothetical protein